MLQRVLIGLFLVFSFALKAQDSTNHYIQSMSHRIATDLAFTNDYSIFKVIGPNTETLLYPNTPNHLRLKVNYDFLSFSLQWSPNFLPGNGDEALKGKTESFQLSSAFIFSHWFSEIQLSRVKGFYLQNSEQVNGWQPGDPYIQFPDLRHQGIQISSGYIFNENFSWRHLRSQTERQIRSAGTFLPVLDLHYFVVDELSAKVGSQKSRNTEISFGPGYAYTYVYRKKYFASIAAFGSLGYMHSDIFTRLSMNEVYSKQDNLLWRWNTKIGIGYNGPLWYSGLNLQMSGSEYQQEHSTLHNSETRIFYQVYLGYRFQSPKVVQEKLNLIKEYIPFL